MEKIEIPLSKKKILLVILGSLMFVALGIYFNVSLADIQDRYNPTIIKVVGWCAIIFFSLTGAYAMYKILDKRPGLVIDQDGIYDNSSAAAIGLIPWNEIEYFQKAEIASTKFLVIYVKNPEVFIERATGWKKNGLKRTMNMYGSPLAISSTVVKYSFNDMEKLFKDRLSVYKSKID